MSDLKVKVTDIKKSMFKFLAQVFRGKVRFRQAMLSCESSYYYIIIIISEAYFSDPEETIKSHTRGINTESSLLFRPRSHLVSRRRPAWKKYWRSDPSMPVTNSVHGPFRETAMQAPLEARCQRMDPYYNCELFTISCNLILLLPLVYDNHFPTL